MRKNRIRVFLASPYRGKNENEVAENIAHARSTAVMLWKQGLAVYAPCLNTAFFSGVTEEQAFIDFNLEMIPFFDVLVTNLGHTGSKGCMDEVKEAKVKKVTKPVVKPKKVIVDNAEVIEVLEAKKGYKLCKMSDGTTKAVEDFRFN